MKYKYKMIRSYTDGCRTKGTDLHRAFEQGYEFVRASEVVKNDDDNYCDYIEYILRREVEE